MLAAVGKPPSKAMAILDPDILLVARSLIRRYDDEAKRHALQRISQLLDDGDAEASELWERVADAIDALMPAHIPSLRS